MVVRMNPSAQNESPVAITLEFTPNPNTLKFMVSRALLERGAANFTSWEAAQASPLARKLFEVPGVTAVLIGTQFVTITKGDLGDWDVLAEKVPQTIEAHLRSGESTVSPAWSPDAAPSTGKDAEIENRIREVLDSDIRPAVAMDGGDITFARYENGTVYLHLQGACSSCPSSTATLKMGVENRLKDRIPEVKEVVQI